MLISYIELLLLILEKYLFNVIIDMVMIAALYEIW